MKQTITWQNFNTQWPKFENIFSSINEKWFRKIVAAFQRMCRLWNIAMCDYQGSVTTGQTNTQTDTWTDRCQRKWSLCATMLCRRHNKTKSFTVTMATTYTSLPHNGSHPPLSVMISVPSSRPNLPNLSPVTTSSVFITLTRYFSLYICTVQLLRATITALKPLGL